MTRTASPSRHLRLATAYGRRKPQAVAGTLHNVMNGLLDVELHASLVDNEDLLGRVAAHNAVQNEMRTGTPEYTYLLSQVMTTDWVSGTF